MQLFEVLVRHPMWEWMTGKMRADAMVFITLHVFGLTSGDTVAWDRLSSMMIAGGGFGHRLQGWDVTMRSVIQSDR